MRVALLTLPWFNLIIPSQRLAALKPYLQAAGIDAFDAHLYLDVAESFGVERYEALFKQLRHQLLLQEASYASLLFPAEIDRILALFADCGVAGVDRGTIADWAAAHERAMDSVDWTGCDLAVFVGHGVMSSPEAHYLAGIYAAKAVKERSPSTRTVLAGSDFVGEIGRSVLEHFPWVDFVINGEPEQALVALARDLQAGRETPIPGVLRRDDEGRVHITAAEQLANLDELPFADYDSYFAHPIAARLGAPLLKLESARGCWWDRSHRDPALSCQFCSINVEWRGYRTLSIERVVAEIAHLHDRYGVPRFAFNDKIHRPKDAAALFGRLADLGRSLEFYGVEVHPSISVAALKEMSRAGVKSVQFGIEALVPDLLQRMNKGVTYPKIVEVLRACAELGVDMHSNLILNYPRTTDADVEETLRRLSQLKGLVPLQRSSLGVGHGSPLSRRPETAGITSIENCTDYPHFLPADLAESLVLMHKTIHTDTPIASWEPVERLLGSWNEAYARTPWAYRRTYAESPVDGQERLVLVHYPPDRPAEALGLTGELRTLYLRCLEATADEDLAAAFPHLDPAWIASALADLVRQGFLIHEDGHYVAVAVHEHSRKLTVVDPEEAPWLRNTSEGRPRLTLKPNPAARRP